MKIGIPSTYVMVCLALAAIGATAHAVKLETSSVTGRAFVVDADTVDVAGTRIRLRGVDAEEMSTPRGRDAKRTMIEIVGGGELSCRLTGEKTHRRDVGFCFKPDGTDINKEIILRGAALSCPRYSDRYTKFEQPAALAARQRSAYCVRR